MTTVILGIADIGINVPVLIAQIVNFVALILLLRLVAYKPILGMLHARSERIREGLMAAERGREAQVEASREAQEAIDAARREGQNIIAQAQVVAQRLSEEGRQQAQVQAEVLITRARSEIQLERDTAINELRREFADLTIAAAEKVIGQSLDRAAHQRLIEQTLADATLRPN
jgi:F-type H+-transporting ATPase subunit b